MSNKMTVLIIGSGAREHTISCAYEKSPQVEKIIVAPGNDFIKYHRQKEVLTDNRCGLKDPESILDIARKYKPDIVDVAQDDALALGTVDLLTENGFRVFGATRKASRIEWDKRWSREFMRKYDIPAPGFRYFDSEKGAEEYAESLYDNEPGKLVFVKASGLCAGKGALKATNVVEAIEKIKQMKKFGEAGRVFLIEDGLRGEEFSVYAISDGNAYYIFKSAQDNKTVSNFDEGAQTGGMGAISPAIVTRNIATEVEDRLISKAIEGMDKEGAPYSGILYLGGVVVDGRPMNIEYNARWGDPECQVVLPGVETDYVDIVTAVIENRLGEVDIREDDKARVCVVGASRGYPGDYSDVKGKRIFGLEEAMNMEGVTIYGAGVAVDGTNFYANGGRLFSVVAEGADILEAKRKAYCAIAHVNIEGNNLHYRTDIGWRDVERYLKSVS
ncbi:phosphoribosylamine--glycine ligase [bacterium]|nr:MAG: phosphoribosylamine--glycine ligase [bacterium]